MNVKTAASLCARRCVYSDTIIDFAWVGYNFEQDSRSLP